MRESGEKNRCFVLEGSGKKRVFGSILGNENFFDRSEMKKNAKKEEESGETNIHLSSDFGKRRERKKTPSSRPCKSIEKSHVPMVSLSL